MTRQQRYELEMLQRVREFGTTHRQLFPESSVGGEALRTVTRAVADIEAHLVAKLRAEEEGRKVKTAARAAVHQRLLDIARTARGMVGADPGLDNKFRMPKVKNDSALLAAARVFVDEAEKVKDRLVSLNLPPSFITDLSEAADAFEQATRGRLAGRSNLAAARAGVTTAVTQGLDAVRLLDVVVTNALKHDPTLLAAWTRDRHIDQRARARQVRGASAAPVPADTPAPVVHSTPDEAPAESLPKAS